jgi:hypothetical protein
MTTREPTPPNRIAGDSLPRWPVGLPFPLLTKAFLGLGLLLRLYHYLRNPSMWHDEAALVLNVLGKSYAGLLGPLYFSEAAPPLFLWVEKAVVALLGESTFALRLVPFVASCGALVALAASARRLLSPPAAACAVLLASCSDRLLWHCCEAKPYAVDALVAAALLWALVRTARWPLNRQFTLFACLAPLLVFLSYPACFLLGGLAVSLSRAVARDKSPRTRLAFGCFVAAAGGAFILLLAGPIAAQRDARLLDCWQDVFPDWDRLWSVPGWTAVRLTEVVRYALEPTGQVLTVLAVVGSLSLWRAGRRRLVTFCLVPVGLACLAGLLGQYPFRASRVIVFTTPAAVLVVAAGLPPAATWLGPLWAGAPAGRPASWGRRLLLCTAGPGLGGCLLFPVCQTLYRVGWPWPRFDSARAAAFVRSRWRRGEGVAGTAWEHDYYFRDQRAVFRALNTGPCDPPPATDRPGPLTGLWLLAAGKTEGERRSYLHDIGCHGRWAVCGRYDFLRTTVFHLRPKGRCRRSGGPPHDGRAISPGRVCLGGSDR